MSTRAWAWSLGLVAPVWAAVAAALVILGEHQ